ncbi:MAG: cytochrome C oxidase subunit IV family protein [Deltaproteobacteria bacterium]
MSDEHAAPAAGEPVAQEGHFPHVNYWAIFGILCVLTLVSALADELGNKGLVLTFVVLAVATAKALFVMGYFMHLKFEGRWKFVLLAPTIILAMAIPAALMPDIGSHYYDYDVPQTRLPEEPAESGHGGESSGGHESASPTH